MCWYMCMYVYVCSELSMCLSVVCTQQWPISINNIPQYPTQTYYGESLCTRKNKLDHICIEFLNLILINYYYYYYKTINVVYGIFDCVLLLSSLRFNYSHLMNKIYSVLCSPWTHLYCYPDPQRWHLALEDQHRD